MLLTLMSIMSKFSLQLSNFQYIIEIYTYIYTVYITQITNFINNIIPNEYTLKLCSIF